MLPDIPNIFTLPIEIGVAILILWIDRRSRKRDQDAMVRQQRIEKRQRELQQDQMDRFNNWIKETSKRQVMLLESIMVTLGDDKADVFKNEVGSRYKSEISDDLEDLESLISQKQGVPSDEETDLDRDIEMKIEELTSAKEIAKNFLPENIINSIHNLAEAAKNSLSDLSLSEMTINNVETAKIVNQFNSDNPDEPLDPAELNKEKFEESRKKIVFHIEDLRNEVAKSVEETTIELTHKIVNLFGQDGKLGQGIKNLVSKGKKTKETSNKDLKDQA